MAEQAVAGHELHHVEAGTFTWLAVHQVAAFLSPGTPAMNCSGILIEKAPVSDCEENAGVVVAKESVGKVEASVQFHVAALVNTDVVARMEV